MRAIWPNSTDPTNSNENGTQLIAGLEHSLKVEILAGDKNMTSNLQPAYGEVGSYESEIFYPTIPTTLSYRIFGDMNGTDFDAIFSYTPEGEQRPAEPKGKIGESRPSKIIELNLYTISENCYTCKYESGTCIRGMYFR